MTISRRHLLLGITALTTFPVAVHAQGQPVRWIVGYPPGGAADFIARVLTPKLQAATDQTFIVENRSGAAGIIGMEALTKADGDGKTIASTGNGELVFNQALYKKLPYDADKDFALVGTTAKIPFVLAVQPKLPVKNVADLVELAKKQPGALNYGSGGVGHPNQMSMELLKKRTGMDIVAVAYRGMAPAVQDFLGGNIAVIFVDLATAVGHVKEGAMRPIAVSTKERLKALPDVPSVQEQGIPDYDVYAWQALIAPASTPKPVVDKYSAALAAALKDPEIVARFEGAGMEPLVSTQAQFAELIQKDKALWQPLIKELNLSAE